MESAQYPDSLPLEHRGAAWVIRHAALQQEHCCQHVAPLQLQQAPCLNRITDALSLCSSVLSDGVYCSRASTSLLAARARVLTFVMHAAYSITTRDLPMAHRLTADAKSLLMSKLFSEQPFCCAVRWATAVIVPTKLHVGA